jgi:hypothetical protein
MHANTKFFFLAKRDRQVFFATWKIPKDLDASLIQSGGVTFYMENLMKNTNYNQGLAFCTRDPRIKKANAISLLPGTIPLGTE